MESFECLDNLKIERPLAVALGYFDGVHLAHKSVIEKAVSFKEKGLTPAVFSFTMDDNCPLKKKGAHLLESLEDKKKRIGDLGCEIFFCPPFSSFMSLSPEEYAKKLLIDTFNAKAVVCGYDYRFGKGAEGDASLLKEILEPVGVEVVTLPAFLNEGEPVSSTRIRDLLLEGNMEKANELLGYKFSIDYEVVHGRHLGNTLGFPTINQLFPEKRIAPKFGVYKTLVTTDEGHFLGVTNVGRKPTVGETDYISAETYIDGFKGDLYGKKVRIEFETFLRPEMKFPSIEELKKAIANDTETARRLYKK